VPDPTAHLALDRLTKRYRDGQPAAVDDIALDVERGSFVSFLGPSGSGKTTTLMMIAGFEAATRGRILLDGRDIAAVPPYRRNFGMVFQNYALFPHMTVAQNVAYPLEVRGIGRDQTARRVAEALDIVGLGGFAVRRPRELSGGQQQRVALARALVFEPTLVLMDEPLGALDKNLREQMQIEIKAIQRRLGITLIYVTHDQGEAMSMSDRIAVFNRGRIEQVASPLDLYARPATRFVGEFVGESNMIEAVVAGGRIDSPWGPLRPARPATADGRVLAMIRPEAIELGAGDEPHNRADIVVDNLVHYGDRVVLLGRCGTAPVKLTAWARDAEGIAPGHTAAVRWRGEDIHLIE